MNPFRRDPFELRRGGGCPCTRASQPLRGPDADGPAGAAARAGNGAPPEPAR
jgi:hypothetical protein